MLLWRLLVIFVVAIIHFCVLTGIKVYLLYTTSGKQNMLISICFASPNFLLPQAIARKTTSHMDSFNIYKGYGKVDHLAGEHQPSSHRYGQRRAVIIAVFSILLLSLIIVSLIGVLHHKSGDPDDDESVDPIRYACKVTQHQETCFGAISAINSHPKPDPVSILSILLRSTMNELRNHLALPKWLMSRVKDHRTVGALEDCGSLLNDAFGSLNQSATKLSGAGELTETAMRDLRTWISAALTDQETCLDGLEEMEASVVEEMRKAVQGAKVGMSNSLAILANMDKLKRDMMKMCRQPKH